MTASPRHLALQTAPERRAVDPWRAALGLFMAEVRFWLLSAWITATAGDWAMSANSLSGAGKRKALSKRLSRIDAAIPEGNRGDYLEIEPLSTVIRRYRIDISDRRYRAGSRKKSAKRYQNRYRDLRRQISGQSRSSPCNRIVISHCQTIIAHPNS